jgi:protein TonB
VKFVVEKDGRLTNIEFLQSPDPVFEEEVIRVLKKSPKWTPGYQQGKPCRVSYVLPIDIRLQ